MSGRYPLEHNKTHTVHDINTLFDLTESKLESVINNLKQMKTQPTTVRNLHKMLADSETFPTHQQANTFFSIFIGILTLLLITILGYLLYRYRALQQQQTIEQPLQMVVD